MNNKEALNSTPMQFPWIPFYMELADKLLTYKEKRNELIEKIKMIFSDADIKLPKLEKDNDISDIDPFTVFALLNKNITDANRIKLATEFHNLFDITAPVPNSFEGVPLLNPQKATFYWFKGERGKHDIDNLWNVFSAALAYAAQDIHQSDFRIAYDIAIKQIGVKWNLSMGLFWIRPYTYINLDTNNREFIQDTTHFPTETVHQLMPLLKKVPNAASYLQIRDLCQNVLDSKVYPYRNFPMLSYTSWRTGKKNNSWFPQDYSPNLSVNEWKQLVKDPTVFTTDSLMIMKRFKDIGGAATCTQLAETYGETKNFYNVGSFTLAQRIHKKTNCPIFNGDDNFKWWPILYVGRPKDKANGQYLWKLRDELSQALDEIDFSNITLYTKDSPSAHELPTDHKITESDSQYWWLAVNPKTWDLENLPVGGTQTYTWYNENGRKHRIFQNFVDAKIGDKIIGYETTPIKQIISLCTVISNENNQLVFTKDEDLSSPIDFSTIKACPELEHMEFLQNAQGSLFKLTTDEYDFLMDMIRESNPAQQDKKATVPYTADDFLNEVFMPKEQEEELLTLLQRKQNIILQGAPGVGKTFAAKRLAYLLMGEKDDSRIQLVQFHQNYSYEDFIMGYKPEDGTFQLKNGIFYTFCQKARNNSSYRPYIFLIDEINRGNLSKIFGELLMLIEKSYRGTGIHLAYDAPNRLFQIPQNVYLIGMMNTADRSLALIDYALRRRFSFFTMKPAFDSPQFQEYQKKLASPVLDALIQQIKELNQDIESDVSLGTGFLIGHSYFCGLEDASNPPAALKSIVQYDIIPMLDEYWFDNKEKSKAWADRLLKVFSHDQ